MTNPSDRFPEYPLWGRYKRAYGWTPGGVDRLLDAGCAWGYGTRFFTDKARSVTGLDPNGEAVEVARQRYPDITFVEGSLEHTEFESEAFDAILCLDVLEHVEDDRQSLGELWRILKPGGRLVLSVPHGGPLGFLDPDNYGADLLAWVKRRLPGLYRRYRRFRGRPDPPAEPALPHREVHRHYTLGQLRELLEATGFREAYELRRVARTGFLIDIAVRNVHFFLGRVLSVRGVAVLERALGLFASLDYRMRYGRLANNVALEIAKR